MTREKKAYSEAFRRMVVREAKKGDLTIVELAAKYNLPHFNTITVWKRYFKNHPELQIDQQFTPLTKAEKHDAEALQLRNKELEKALAMADLRITGLETMIEIAEKELRIDIRKKSGSKPSKS